MRYLFKKTKNMFQHFCKNGTMPHPRSPEHSTEEDTSSALRSCTDIWVQNGLKIAKNCQQKEWKVIWDLQPEKKDGYKIYKIT